MSKKKLVLRRQLQPRVLPDSRPIRSFAAPKDPDTQEYPAQRIRTEFTYVRDGGTFFRISPADEDVAYVRAGRNAVFLRGSMLAFIPMQSGTVVTVSEPRELTPEGIAALNAHEREGDSYTRELRESLLRSLGSRR